MISLKLNRTLGLLFKGVVLMQLLMPLLTVGFFNAKGQTMIVNEIMFKPGPTVTGCDQKLFVRVPNGNNIPGTCGREYIEMYNSDCNNDYDMSGYVLGSCQATSGIYENGGSFMFPPGTIVPAGGFLIVGGPDEDDGNNGTFVYTIGSIDIKLNAFHGTDYIATVSNGYWFLPNVDGWMAIYEPNGDVHSAVYWTTQATNINSVAEFNAAPPAPAAYTGAPLKSARQIFQTTPALIEWVGPATATNTGFTLSRMPDGGAWQANMPPTIGPNRPDRCNDGNCLACGNLQLTPVSDTCSASVGTLELSIPSPGNSPPPYTYIVSGPGGYSNTFTTSSNPYLLTGLAAGDYFVTVVDNFSPPNTTTRNATIDDIAGATLSTSSTPDNCNTQTGSATVTVNGGTPPYTYNWQGYPANNSATLSNIPAGTYHVTVTGNNGSCPVSANIIVVNTGSVTATASSTNDVCGQANGTATVSPSQPAAQCTFSWNPGGQTTQTATGLTAGSYTCIVTYNGCSVTVNTTVQASGTIQAGITGQNPLCSGQSNGSVTVTVTQGTTPYVYIWSNGATASTVSNATAGNYSVTVTSADGCSVTLTYTLTSPSSLSSQITQSANVSCNGGSNGSATVSATGGTPPYTYNWTGGSSGLTANGLAAGSYNVTVTDGGSCTSVTQVVITEPTAVTSQITATTHVTCYNGSNGSTTVTASGGTPPYTYSWANGQHGSTATGLIPGQYSVIVSDANGCTSSSGSQINNAAPITVTVPAGQVGCSGNNDGSLTPSVTGGTLPYSFVWSNGQSGGTASQLSAGMYLVTVTDNNGCTATGSGTVSSPTPVMVGLPASQTICPNASFLLSMSVTGGVAPYSYFWNGSSGASDITVQPQQTTTYTAWAVDASGCSSAQQTITLTVAPGISLYAASNITSVCPGDPVIIAATVTGGIGGPYTIYDSNGNYVSSPFTVYPTQSGNITVTAEDGCGSTATTFITIEVYAVPVLSFLTDILEGCEPLQVQFTELQPELTTSVVWDFGDSPNLSLAHNPVHIYREDGVFTVSYQYTSHNGCSSSVVIPNMITVFPKPDAGFTTEPEMPSVIHPEINFTNLSAGAVAYQWYFGDGDSASHPHPSHLYSGDGDFQATLVAISNRGCKDTVTKLISIAPEFTFYVPTAFSPDGNGINDLFYVSGHGIDPERFGLVIYDRWGEKVFESTKYDESNPQVGAWDGRIKGHRDSPVGTYTWLAIYYTTNGNKREFAGTVTLIR